MEPRIGDRLHGARTARGLTLEEISERTKIRVRFLRALEEERWELLPGAAYTRAFLRSYARIVGLDGAELVEDYRRWEEPEEDLDAPAQLPDEHISQGLGSRALGRAGAALGERLPGHGGDEAPLRAAGPGRRGPAAIVLAVVAALAVAALLLSSIGDGGDEADEQAGAGSAATTPSDEAPTTPTEEPDRSRAKVSIEAVGEVWVCLVDRDGEPLIAGETLAAGETRGPFQARSFEVTLGNGDVEMTANGEPVDVPAAAEPLGYKITSEHARDLPSAAQPTCG